MSPLGRAEEAYWAAGAAEEGGGPAGWTSAGNFTTKVAPPLGLFSHLISPPWSCTMP